MDEKKQADLHRRACLISLKNFIFPPYGFLFKHKKKEQVNDFRVKKLNVATI